MHKSLFIPIFEERRSIIQGLMQALVLLCIMRDRLFSNYAVNHCYQRTSDHGILFYTVRDHLVFFTIFCTRATRHQIQVLKLAQMPDHTHHSSIAQTRKQLSDFQRDYTSVFAKEYNRTFGLSGPVFETPFSSAVKRRDKDIRTNLIYVDNNPVERKLVKKAEDYRWNYLAYARSPHPFSNKIVLRQASMPLRRALKRVEYMKSQGRYLTYALLDRLFASLTSKQEKEQLTDFIITTYSVLDYAAAIHYFGSYEEELIATHSTTGSEYDIIEGFIGKSDAHYARFTKILLQKGLAWDIHEVLTLPDEGKQHLLTLLHRESSAPEKQIRAFLHLPVDINSSNRAV